MKAQFKNVLFALIIMLPGGITAQKQFTLNAPSGKLRVDVNIEKTDISYSVWHDNDLMLDRSPISMTLTDGTQFGINPRLRKSKTKTVDQTIYPPIYKKKSIHDHYNELVLEFKGGYNLVFRAYDDGMAYRFISQLKEPFLVQDEQVELNFPNDPQVYVAFPKGRLNEGKEDPFYSSFQNTYLHTPLSKWDNGKLAFLPILVEGANGKKVCVTEADLLNYPGLYLKNNRETKHLEGVFAAYPKEVKLEVKNLKGVVKSREPYIAKAEGSTAFPWRVLIVSEHDTDLLNNDMVYKLATPAQKADYSWIKPGKVAWDWWNNWNIYQVDFESGINNETYKYYIDFASQQGIEYVILDEGWSVPGEADLMQVVPEIDLKELIRYAGERNVGIILWAGFHAFDRDMDRVCKHYAEMGIKGFKIDFMDRDDQYMIDFNRRCAETGAKYKLLIDLHGTSKPTGLQRTYPNTINFEGVHGLEELKWAEPGTDQVAYDVTLPFIRMVAGPIDYTQGAMNNAIMKNFNAVYEEPMSQGTRCRQLALYVIFDSPISMLCDAPTNYLKEEECTEFITSIPTVWDQTVPLAEEVAKYISMARQKDGVWYLASITDWEPRDVEIELSFLAPGQYKAEIFRDGINADKVGKDYKKEIIDVTAGQRLKVHMAPGGGFAMKIYK
ncbi:glycoside hydrolase family 97 protein [Barnesiella viscericola]|uniref:glycoside hydrolase family 97 protein n=1 Tax=Barnesiella viscericola TaxID=397865 RepID=UPI00320AFD60